MNDLWDLTLRFFSLVDANVRFVLAGTTMLGAAGGVIGSFAFLQRKSLVGDALAHAALPGVCVAFMLTGVKAPLVLLLGAGITGWLGALAINYIIKKSRLKLDAALGLTLSVFFGIGVTLLTIIQHSGSGAQAGLDKFIFGQAAALGSDDALVMLAVTSIIFLLVGFLFKEFKLITFDQAFSFSVGRPTGLLQTTLTTLIVFAVVVGLQAVGVVLMAAMLVTPAAAARQWTNSLEKMVLLAGAIGAFSGIVGAYISFLAPQLPTGPWIVVSAGFVFVISLVFAPERGLLSQALRRRDAQRRVVRDHLLKAFYRLTRETSAAKAPADVFSLATIADEARLESQQALSALSRLKKNNLAAEFDYGWTLTTPGRGAAARLVKLHRLWEVYLSRYLSLPADHVHRDADELEHLITPEMEAQLEALLERPERDPHDSIIPYQDGASGERSNRNPVE